MIQNNVRELGWECFVSLDNVSQSDLCVFLKFIFVYSFWNDRKTIYPSHFKFQIGIMALVTSNQKSINQMWRFNFISRLRWRNFALWNAIEFIVVAFFLFLFCVCVCVCVISCRTPMLPSIIKWNNCISVCMHYLDIYVVTV